MPFKSEAQRRYLEANHPEVAKQFSAETPKDAELPPRVGAKPLPEPPARGSGFKRMFPNR